jgi:hypothetical protein
MRAFTNSGSSRRSSSSCSYCGESEHRVTDCPYAEKDWASLQGGIIPLNTVTPRAWYKNPKYWSDWYSRAEKAAASIEAARQRATQRRTPTTTPRTCGFCGSADHTRRNCAQMAAFVAKCEKANENWRREAYKWLVDNGLYIGSAIQIQEKSWKGPGEKHIALITSINLDDINVMTAFNTRWQSDAATNYVQPIKIVATFNGQTKTINIGDLVKSDSPVSERASANYNTYSYVRKLTSTATPPSEDWITSYKAAWTWLAKRKSYEWLKDNKIVEHIETWAAKAQ